MWLSKLMWLAEHSEEAKEKSVAREQETTGSMQRYA